MAILLDDLAFFHLICDKNRQWQRADYDAGDKRCPIYTICFYHGTEKWNGPRSLKDMMDFGKSEEEWKDCFQDYHMFLFCVGEQSDLSGFHTELKLLLEVLRLRQDKEEMDRLWDREDFSHVQREPAGVVCGSRVNLL